MVHSGLRTGLVQSQTKEAEKSRIRYVKKRSVCLVLVATNLNHQSEVMARVVHSVPVWIVVPLFFFFFTLCHGSISNYAKARQVRALSGHDAAQSLYSVIVNDTAK
jgi:hypothetical protein